MQKRILFAVLVCMPVACKAAPSEADFAADMLSRLRAKTPDKEFRIKRGEPLVIQIKDGGDWNGGAINLHRLHGYCLEAKSADCEAVKKEFVRKINVRLPSASADRLRLIVRGQTYADYIDQTFKETPTRPIYRPIGEQAYAILAIDGADTIQLASRKLLGEMGMTADEAWVLAARQTKAILPEIPLENLRKNGAVAFQDFEYLASLLADTERWKPIAAEFGSDLFITAVSDHFVFVGLMPDGPKMNEFKKTVSDDCKAQERCVLPFVYRFRDGRWTIAN